MKNYFASHNGQSSGSIPKGCNSPVCTHFTDSEAESQGIELLCLTAYKAAMKTIMDPDILTPGSMGKQTRGTLDSREKVFFKEEGTACLKS